MYVSFFDYLRVQTEVWKLVMATGSTPLKSIYLRYSDSFWVSPTKRVSLSSIEFKHIRG